MEDEKIYRWVTHGRSTCDVCSALEGREMGLADWRSRVLPGIHAGCDCSLEPVEDLQSGKRVIRTFLKMGSPKKSAQRNSVDKRLTHSHGALKPLVRVLKAALPEVKSRPRTPLISGGGHGRTR
jgi:hypothetical protein